MRDLPQIDLNIRGESVQEIYSWYLAGRLVANRRYQRKLVWTKEEKSQLIDTMFKRYPMPIIILAEVEIGGALKYEIIDGMQRLNAIFSFVENKIDLRSEYFDLNTMAMAKQLVDEKKLIQISPVLDRTQCAHFANYKVPISTYKIDETEHIDEIFRRINSGGRRLSNQEIRQAGVTGAFADLVRTLSSSIRGDVSHADILLLNDMETISITNKDLDYGIKVEDIHWVRHGILRKEDIRDSKDEDLVADLVAYIIHPESNKPASSSQVLDLYYGRASELSDRSQEKAEERHREVDLLVNKEGEQVIRKRFLATYDVMKQILIAATGSGTAKFKELIGMSGTLMDRAPRYYQVIFLALYDLLFGEKKQISDLNGLISALAAIAGHIDVSTGGHWSAPNRVSNVSAVKGIIRKYFADNPLDPVSITGITEFENLLTRSRTETPNYDFKQGLHRLDAAGAYDVAAFEKILETICAIANLGKNKIGYVVLGVADKQSDAQRIEQLHRIKSIKYGHFYVTGLEHEAAKHTNLDKYLQFVSNAIHQSELSDPIKAKVSSNISSITYHGKTVFVIKVEAGAEPCLLGDKMFRRIGAQTFEVSVKEMGQIYKLFS